MWPKLVTLFNFLEDPFFVELDIRDPKMLSLQAMCGGIAAKTGAMNEIILAHSRKDFRKDIHLS